MDIDSLLAIMFLVELDNEHKKLCERANFQRKFSKKKIEEEEYKS